MTDDLVQRLRDDESYYRIQEKHWCIDAEELERQRLAAADRIEVLRAENERLREALKDALSHCYNCSGDPHYIEEDEATGDHLWTDCPVCRSARAALGEQQ